MAAAGSRKQGAGVRHTQGQEHDQHSKYADNAEAARSLPGVDRLSLSSLSAELPLPSLACVTGLLSSGSIILGNFDQ